MKKTGKSTFRRTTAATGVEGTETPHRSMAIGRAGMMKINSLEGIVTSEDSRARLAEFDRRGLSPAERRAEIVKAFTRKT